MTGTVTIAAKELRCYLLSPVAWVVATVFLGVTGLLFYNLVSWYSLQSYQLMQVPDAAAGINVNRLVFEPIFHNVAVVMLLLVPMVTMRLLAEERRQGTLQLLYTSPVRLTGVVLGKYLAAVVLLSGILLLTLYMPLLVWGFGSLEWGPIGSAYLGLLLLSAAFAACGLFASSVTENQIIAAVLTFGLLLGFWLLGWAGQAGDAGVVLEQLSVIAHLDSFLRGVVQTRDVVYYLSVIVLGLFLTHRVLESGRWR